MIIAICGSPGSGKSSLTLKLAKAFANSGKQTIVIHTDYYAPAFVSFFPSEEEHGSLGKLLSLPEISQELILKNMNTLKHEESIGIIGYGKTENKYQYPEYTKDRAVSTIIQLKHIAEVILIDCQTAFFEDLFAITAIEMADKTLRLLTADLKGLSYYKSCMSLLSDSRFSPEKHIKIIQDTTGTELAGVVADHISGADMVIPYTPELKEQFKEEQILSPLAKRGKDYEKSILRLLEGLKE